MAGTVTPRDLRGALRLLVRRVDQYENQRRETDDYAEEQALCTGVVAEQQATGQQNKEKKKPEPEQERERHPYQLSYVYRTFDLM